MPWFVIPGIIGLFGFGYLFDQAGESMEQTGTAGLKLAAGFTISALAFGLVTGRVKL